MTINKENIEKSCCFYASDFHLEMTLVPYINKKIEEGKEVIIVTQNKLEETLKMLISRMNIRNKDEILKIDWNNNCIQKNIVKDNLVIITNGSMQFINDKNREIKEILEDKGIELVDCYFFDEVKEKLVEIRDSYKGVLNNFQKSY